MVFVFTLFLRLEGQQTDGQHWQRQKHKLKQQLFSFGTSYSSFYTYDLVDCAGTSVLRF